MKQFAKVVSIFAGIVVLVMVGLFAVKSVMVRTADQNANMRAIMQADTENGAAGAVFNNTADGEIVTIPDDEVITDTFTPPEEDAIPVGPGVIAAPDTADVGQTSKFLYDNAVAYIAQPEHREAVLALLSAEPSGKVMIDANQPEGGLAKSFFSEFLGTANYTGCRVGFALKNGDAAVEFASAMQDDTAAAYAARIDQAGEAEVKTEVTEVTVLAGLKKTVVTTTVVTTTTPDGTDVQSSVSTRTEKI